MNLKGIYEIKLYGLENFHKHNFFRKAMGEYSLELGQMHGEIKRSERCLQNALNEIDNLKKMDWDDTPTAPAEIEIFKEMVADEERNIKEQKDDINNIIFFGAMNDISHFIRNNILEDESFQIMLGLRNILVDYCCESKDLRDEDIWFVYHKINRVGMLSKHLLKDMAQNRKWRKRCKLKPMEAPK